MCEFFLINMMKRIPNILGGDRACPLPLPTPPHCDWAVLPVLGSVIIRGYPSGGGKAPKSGHTFSNFIGI
jgi:hypothetical protein